MSNTLLRGQRHLHRLPDGIATNVVDDCLKCVVHPIHVAISICMQLDSLVVQRTMHAKHKALARLS